MSLITAKSMGFQQPEKKITLSQYVNERENLLFNPHEYDIKA